MKFKAFLLELYFYLFFYRLCIRVPKNCSLYLEQKEIWINFWQRYCHYLIIHFLIQKKKICISLIQCNKIFQMINNTIKIIIILILQFFSEKAIFWKEILYQISQFWRWYIEIWWQWIKLVGLNKNEFSVIFSNDNE